MLNKMLDVLKRLKMIKVIDELNRQLEQIKIHRANEVELIHPYELVIGDLNKPNTKPLSKYNTEKWTFGL
jgi:hypothetical protein